MEYWADDSMIMLIESLVSQSMLLPRRPHGRMPWWGYRSKTVLGVDLGGAACDDQALPRCCEAAMWGEQDRHRAPCPLRPLLNGT